MQFVFFGRVELSECKFVVDAENEDEARQKLNQGEWGEVETACGQFKNWTITQLYAVTRFYDIE